VCVVKVLLRRLAGAQPQRLVPLPVRAAFAYKKKKDRREYVRVALKRGSDGEVDAVKHPQDGAGILTSLTETDGLLEFPEDVTAIEPGARVGFLSYATLMG
jgi:molybdopterin molybdotransferase